MRTLYDPFTIIAGVISVGASLFQGIIAGNAAQAAADADAAFLTEQAQTEAVASAREKRDAERDRESSIARKLALFAAQGGSTSGNALAVLQDTREEFDIGITRLVSDSALRQRSLLARAQNVKAGGQLQKSAAIFGGVASASKTGVSLLNIAPAAT